MSKVFVHFIDRLHQPSLRLDVVLLSCLTSKNYTEAKCSRKYSGLTKSCCSLRGKNRRGSKYTRSIGLSHKFTTNVCSSTTYSNEKTTESTVSDAFSANDSHSMHKHYLNLYLYSSVPKFNNAPVLEHLENCPLIQKRHCSNSRNQEIVNPVEKNVMDTSCINSYKKQLLGERPLSPPSKTLKYLKRMLPHLMTSDNEESCPSMVSVEKELMALMEKWNLEDAVKVLKISVRDGVNPDRTIVLDLLQQLANLGEVDCLLELQEFLQDNGLASHLRFYHCLCDAYCNSGRIEEGIRMSRNMYLTHDIDDRELLFTLLATVTIKHFDHLRALIVDLVEELVESDPPIPSARASLWRCLVLAEKFDEAEALLEEHTELKKMVPSQVTKIIQCHLEVGYQRETVLQWLLQLPHIKSGLKASVFDSLIQFKSKEGKWDEALELLSCAQEEGMKVHQHTVTHFLAEFLGQLSQSHVQQLSHWVEGLENDAESEDHEEINR